MKKYIKEFIHDLEMKIQKNHKFSNEELNFIRIKITDFQHERLIHLLVTLFYAIFTLFFLVLSRIEVIFFLPFLFEIIFLIFYIKHYFFLENAVQYIYQLYDTILLSSSTKKNKS